MVAIVPAGSNVVAYLRRDRPRPTPPTRPRRTPSSDATASTVDSASPRPTPRATAATSPDASAATTSAAGWARAARVVVAERDHDDRRLVVGLRVGRGARGGPTRNSSRRRPARRRPRRRRRCRPGGTPIRPGASSCATGTARRGPSTCRAAVSSPPTRRSPDRPATPRLLTAGPGPMRVTSLGQAGLLVETAHGIDPVRSVVRAGVPRFVVRVPAQRPARRRTARAHRDRPTTCTCRTSTATTSTRCGWPITCRGTSRCSCPATRPASSTSGCARSASPTWCARSTGDELDLGRTDRRHPHRDLDHRRSGRRLGARRQRRHVAPRRPERLPHHRPRRAGAPTARSTCTGCSTAGRSGTRWCTSSTRRRCARSSTPRSRAS